MDAAAQNELPICQDTGMACVFIELGQDGHINGDLQAAVDEGVRRGYAEGTCAKALPATRCSAKIQTTTPRLF